MKTNLNNKVEVLMKFVLILIFGLISSQSKANSIAPSTEIVVGSKTPIVILYEYGSLTCHVCAKFSTQVKDRLLKEYGEQLQIIMRPFPFNKIDIEGFKGIFCSADPVKAANLIYAKQDEWIAEKDQIQTVMKLLQDMQGSSAQFKKCITNEQLEKQIIMRRNLLKAGAAPVLRIGKVKVIGLPKQTTLDDWIKEAIQFVKSGNNLSDFVGSSELRKALGLKQIKNVKKHKK